MTSTSPPGRTRRAVSIAVALFVLPVAGCSLTAGTDGVHAPAVPTPSASAARYCRALHAKLPRAVNGLRRRHVSPASDYTAVWGDPEVQLRCGVPRPAALSPDSKHYDPQGDAAEIDGVEWLPQKQKEGYRFTTVLRRAYVEVTVPKKYYPEVNPLIDLAKPVKKTVPVGVV